MKKLLLMTMMLASCILVKAQNYLQMYIDDIEPNQDFEFCLQDYDSIVIVDTVYNFAYSNHWYVYPVYGINDYYEPGPVLTLIPGDDDNNSAFVVSYQYYQSYGADWFWFRIWFKGFSAPDPWFPEYEWKHGGDSIALTAPQNTSNLYYWDYEWSTGENQREIEVVDPGIYWTRLYNNCGEAIDSVEIRDCVDISLASTDLATNLNRLSWLVDDAQSAYIAEVNVYRNGHLVGTAPYAEGSFLDNIGSGVTQWQYHLVGMTTDGEECPVPSYWNRPIHLDHLQGQDNHVLQWTSFETENGASIEAYRIYDWTDGELTFVDEVGYFANVYNYNPDDFKGEAVVAAVFGSGEMSYSNRVPTKDYDLAGAEWYYEIENGDGSITYQHLEYAADTTVNDKTVVIIIRTNTLYDKAGHSEVTREYVYEEGGEVYWWNKDLEEFTMLYDFNAEVGDEWEIKVGTQGLTMHVDAVEYVDYDSVFYRMMYVSDLDNLFSGSILCGVGHLTSFFPEQLMTQGKNYRVDGLRCYWKNGFLTLKYGDKDCDEVYGELHNGIEENGPSTGSGALTVYPNPTHNVLVVETVCTPSLPDQTYRITNLMGQTLQSGTITAETLQVDVSALPQGMYFISVGDVTRKFVVNQ